MGIVVQFPDAPRPPRFDRDIAFGAEPASVVILPVVRIERQLDLPSALDGRPGPGPMRGRRKRSQRT